MKRMLVVFAALGALLGFSGTAEAAKPTIERIDVQESFDDTPPGGTAISGTVSANGIDYRFRDVGADLVRITPDGVAILSIIGQVPFAFNGVLKINLDTEEVIHEPQHLTADEVDKACQVLAG